MLDLVCDGLLAAALGQAVAAELVQRLERSHPEREAAPRLQTGWELGRVVVLEVVDGGDEDDRDEEHASHRHHQHVRGQRERNKERRDQEEHDDDVRDREPPVLRGDVAERTGHCDRERPERPDHVPYRDPEDVKEEVRERDGQCVLQLGAVGGQRGQDTGDGGADVRSEDGRVHPLELDDADPDERGEGGGGDRRGLDREGEPEAGEHGKVAGDPTHRDDGRAAVLVAGASDRSAANVRDVAVDDGVEPDRDPALEDRAEDQDDQIEAGAEDGQRQHQHQ